MKEKLISTIFILLLFSSACSYTENVKTEKEEVTTHSENPDIENDMDLSVHYSAETTFNGIKIENWMYQLQNLYERDMVDKLDKTDFDMLVVEPGHNFTEWPYDTEYIVESLKFKENGEERILLAYIDIGQAEDYRDYWGGDWIAPTTRIIGYPDFLITIDPDGWSGNYPVAYWYSDWKDIWLSENGIIKTLVEYGFDGVYLDWVEAYDDEYILALAEEAGVDAPLEMMIFIDEIGMAGKEINPDFLVIPQNAPYLLDYDSDYYLSIIHAVAMEDTWFYGEGDADWNDKNAGDLQGGERHSEDYSTENRIIQNLKYLEMNIPVFTIDYCIDEDNAKFVYTEAEKFGFVSLVTRVSLSDITETPMNMELLIQEK